MQISNSILLDNFKTLSKHSILYGLSGILSYVTSVLLVPIYTRILTPSDYGIMSILEITGTIIFIIINAGMAQSMLRLYHDSNEGEDRSMLISSIIIFCFVLGAILLSPLLINAELLSNLLFANKEYKYFILLIAGGVLFQSISQIGASYLRTQQASKIVSIINFALLVSGISISILLVVFFQRKLQGAIEAIFLTQLLKFTIYLPFLLKHITLKVSWSWIRASLIFGLPFIPHNLAGYLLYSADRYILNIYTDYHQIGLYSLGYKFGMILNLPLQAFLIAWAPFVYSIMNTQEGIRQIGKLASYLVILICFFGTWISLCALDILKILTPESYWPASQVVPLIVLSYVILGSDEVLKEGISIVKKTKFYMVGSLSACLINIGLNFILIPHYGIMGSAIATVIGYGVWLVIDLEISNRVFPISFEYSRLFFGFLVCIILFLLFSKFEFWSSIFNIFIKTIVVFISFLIFLKRDERRVLLALGLKILTLRKR